MNSHSYFNSTFGSGFGRKIITFFCTKTPTKNSSNSRSISKLASISKTLRGQFLVCLMLLVLFCLIRSKDFHLLHNSTFWNMFCRVLQRIINIACVCKCNRNLVFMIIIAASCAPTGTVSAPRFSTGGPFVPYCPRVPVFLIHVFIQPMITPV